MLGVDGVVDEDELAGGGGGGAAAAAVDRTGETRSEAAASSERVLDTACSGTAGRRMVERGGVAPEAGGWGGLGEVWWKGDVPGPWDRYTRRV
jgi:hypothetical protein